MPDGADLREAYLERLADQLPLPPDERAAVLEEIAAHVSVATEDLVARGIPADVAERQALERLGPPDRLARDLAAAHRTPANLLQAAGVALRVTLVTGFKTLLLIYAIAFTAFFAAALAYSLLRKWTGIDIGLVWGPVWEGLYVGGASGITAYAIGRLLPPAVSVAARRPVERVRWVIGGIGAALAAWIGWFGIDARWMLPGAAVMAMLPAWFVLGVVRPGLLPRWFPGAARTVILAMLVVAVASFGLFYATGGPSGEGGGAQPQAWDPGEWFGAIAPFAGSPEEPLALLDATAAGESYRGAQPTTWSIDGELAPGASLVGWTDLHLEVWPSSADRVGPTAPPTGQSAPREGPIAIGEIALRGRDVTGSVTFLPRPDADGYYFALIGRDPDGARKQLGWPSWGPWTWSGSVWQYVMALVATGT
jgi:hypothetical protein